MPNALDIQNFSKGVEADSAGQSAGSFGTCEIGFVRYWFNVDQSNRNRSMSSAAVYLEEYGEYWCFSHGPFSHGSNDLSLSLPGIISFWGRSMTEALDLFDELGAPKRRLLEIGATGIDGARLLRANQFFGAPTSRKPHLRRSAQEAVWDAPNVRALLRQTCDDLLLAFSQPRISEEAFGELWSR
jgi:hypothetical protein